MIAQHLEHLVHVYVNICVSFLGKCLLSLNWLVKCIDDAKHFEFCIYSRCECPLRAILYQGYLLFWRFSLAALYPLPCCQTLQKKKKKLSIPVRMFMAFVFKDQMTLQTLVAYSLYRPSILVSVSVLMLASPCCPDSWSVLSFETWYERVSTWLFFLTFSLFVVRLPCRKNIIAVFQGLHKFGEGLWGYKFPQY